MNMIQILPEISDDDYIHILITGDAGDADMMNALVKYMGSDNKYILPVFMDIAMSKLTGKVSDQNKAHIT